jgi:hypothetical protein
MADEINRARYCALVGIDPSTLSRWVGDKVIVPRIEGAHGRQVFTESDVHFGRALKALLTQYPGRYALREMVEVVRGERELDEYHSPYSPPGGRDVRRRREQER